MKFIFPQNYNFAHQFLGFIEYSTLFLNLLWGFFVYFICRIFPIGFTLQIALFIILFLPVFLFSLVGFNHEKVTYIIRYCYIYLKRPKCYLYKKVNS